MVDKKKKKKNGRVTNSMFAANDRVFIEACTLAGIANTTRQASKYRMGKGRAILFKVPAVAELKRKGVITDE